MRLCIRISPYHYSLLEIIEENITTACEDLNYSDQKRERMTRTILTHVLKCTYRDSFGHESEIVREELRISLTTQRFTMSQLAISHMVEEVIESTAYRRIKQRVMDAVASVSEMRKSTLSHRINPEGSVIYVRMI